MELVLIDLKVKFIGLNDIRNTDILFLMPHKIGRPLLHDVRPVPIGKVDMKVLHEYQVSFIHVKLQLDIVHDKFMASFHQALKDLLDIEIINDLLGIPIGDLEHDQTQGDASKIL